MGYNETNINKLNHFVIKIAGLNIEIETVSPSTYAYCIHYLSNEQPDLKVKVTKEDIQHEISTAKRISSVVNEPYLETIAVYRKVVNVLSDFNIFLMHGAVVAINNDAFLFTAPSGTGKTTHVKLWLKNSEEAFIVNGDKPLIKITENEVLACGSPWNGKERLGVEKTVPLKAIIFLERSDYNQMKEISYLKAYPYLIQSTHLSSNSAIAKKELELVARLNGRVSFWHFDCNNFKEDCFDVAFQSLVKNRNKS